MTEAIVNNFLTSLASSANNGEYDQHMDHISKTVQVYGFPGFDVIGYEDWARQCKHEFENKVLKSVHYEGMNLLANTEQRITFTTHETVEGTDGTKNQMGIEIVLELEDDGKWRITQERIVPAEETQQDELTEPSMH